MKDIIYAIKYMITLLDRQSKSTFFISYTLFILGTATRIITPMVFAWFVVEPHNLESGLLWGVVAYAGIFFTNSFLAELRSFLYTSLLYKITKKQTLNIINLFFTLPLSVIQNKSPSEHAYAIVRGMGGLQSITNGIIFSLTPIMVEGLVIFTIIGFRTNWSMALWVLFILISFIFITLKLSKRIRALREESHRISTNNYKILSESLHSYETIRSFEQSQWVQNRNGIGIDSYIEKSTMSLRSNITLGLIQGALIALFIGSTTGAVLASDATLNEKIVNIVLVNTLSLQMIAPLQSFSNIYDAIIGGLASARQLLDILKVTPIKAKIEHLEYSGQAEFKITNLIVKRDERTTLDINELLIPKQKLITISGPSGAGKTTLAKCLAGLNEYEGKIYSRQKTEHIFFMTQKVHVFDTTIENNITLGLPMDTDKFSWALKHAGISEEEYQNWKNAVLARVEQMLRAGSSSA